jgi:hypothetical protein
LITDCPPINGTLRFEEGSNVLEGIKEMVLLGIAQPPLREFFTGVRDVARNHLKADLNGRIVDALADNDD